MAEEVRPDNVMDNDHCREVKVNNIDECKQGE
jgi:hypothetical protein